MRDRGPPPRHNGAVKAYLVETDGSSAEDVDAERVRRALAAGTLLWLDIDEADDEAVAVLRDVFELHPIALENAAVFRQRPRIEGYEDFSYLVAYGARGGEAGDPSGTGGAAGADGRLGAEHDGGTDHGAARDAHRGAGRHDSGRRVGRRVRRRADRAGTRADQGYQADQRYEGEQGMVEVHCFYAPRYLVTLHREPLPAADDIRRRARSGRQFADDRLAMLYRVLDTLVDSLFPLLTDFDDRIDELQDAIFVHPTDSQLSAMFAMKRWLVSVRKQVSPQRDMLDSLINGATELDGMTGEHERYFRALYDHLIRLTDLIDSYRDLLTDSMDAYLSVVSNRMNVVMKQLTVISTVFLPLTFLTGFFGQNFAWLVNHVGSLATFLLAGLGADILAVGLLLVFLRKRRWI